MQPYSYLSLGLPLKKILQKTTSYLVYLKNSLTTGASNQRAKGNLLSTINDNYGIKGPPLHQSRYQLKISQRNGVEIMLFSKGERLLQIEEKLTNLIGKSLAYLKRMSSIRRQVSYYQCWEGFAQQNIFQLRNQIIGKGTWLLSLLLFTIHARLLRPLRYALQLSSRCRNSVAIQSFDKRQHSYLRLGA